VFIGASIVGLVAQQAAPSLTRDESRLQQIAQLQAQLSQVQAADAACEANGPASYKTVQAYQQTMGELMKSLDARGLVLDPQTGQVKEKPKPEEKKP
jgi:phage-related minor tail protein